MTADIRTLFEITAAVIGGNAVKELGKELSKVSNTGDKLQRSFAQAGVALKAFAASQAVGFVKDLVMSGINLADNLNDISQRTGVAVEQLARYKVVADNSGTSIEAVAKLFVKLNNSIVDARDGTGKSAGAFKAMGISVKDASGKLKNADQITEEMAARFEHFPDGPQKSALAMAVFGKSGADMIPILNQGSEAMKAFTLNVDTEFAQAADEFNDKIGLMKVGVMNLGIEFSKELIPVLGETADDMKALFQEATPYAVIFGNVLSDVFRFLKIGAAGLLLSLRNMVATFRFLITQARAVAEAAKGNFTGAERMRAGAGQRLNYDLTENQARFDIYASQQSEKTNLFQYLGGDAPKEADKQTKELTAAQKDANAAMAAYTGEGEKAEKEDKKRTKAIKELKEEVIEFGQSVSRNFGAGATQFFTEFSETAFDTASQVKEVFGNAFKGAEDAIIEFSKTGKLNFKSFALSVIEDIARIQLHRQFAGFGESLLSGLTGMFGGGGATYSTLPIGPGGTSYLLADGGVMSSRGKVPLNKYASGGIASSPQLAVFGEGRMPEAFVPLPDGQNIPVKLSGGGGGGATVNVTINMATGSTSMSGDGKQAKDLATTIAAVCKATIVKEQRPGGVLAQ